MVIQVIRCKISLETVTECYVTILRDRYVKYYPSPANHSGGLARAVRGTLVEQTSMMASAKKKQDEKNLKLLRDLAALPHNKKCFDCGQRGPTYVNTTIGSFVCTSCSGILWVESAEIFASFFVLLVEWLGFAALPNVNFPLCFTFIQKRTKPSSSSEVNLDD